MTTVVYRYGQPTEAQPLARVGQTAGVGVAGMTLGGVTIDVPNRLLGGSCARAR
jgi:hypothetical protein